LPASSQLRTRLKKKKKNEYSFVPLSQVRGTSNSAEGEVLPGVGTVLGAQKPSGRWIVWASYFERHSYPVRKVRDALDGRPADEEENLFKSRSVKGVRRKTRATVGKVMKSMGCTATLLGNPLRGCAGKTNE